METSSRAILFAIAAGLLFAIAAAMAKSALETFHVFQILFFRQLMVFVSALPAIHRSFPGSIKTSRPGLHLLRLAGAFTALSCGIWAVGLLPLVTATTLSFAQVFFVAILAFLFLGEPVGPHRVLAIIGGFLGVLVVMQPDAAGFFDLAILVPLVGALGAAIAITCVRRLTATESTATLLIYQSAVVGLLAALPLIFFWVTPDLSGLLFLIAIGIVSAIAQWMGVHALRLAEASLVGSLEYLRLIYASLIGYILFFEVPDRPTMLGAAIIIAAALYLIHRERLRTRTKPG